MRFDAYPIVSGIAALGCKGATDVYVSSDIAGGILDAAPRTPQFRTRDDIHNDPYTLRTLVVTFHHDPELPFRTLAIARGDNRERYDLVHILTLGI
jgi:hypothetical protein